MGKELRARPRKNIKGERTASEEGVIMKERRNKSKSEETGRRVGKKDKHMAKIGKVRRKSESEEED